MFFLRHFLEFMQRFATKSRFFEVLDIVATNRSLSASIVYSRLQRKIMGLGILITLIGFIGSVALYLAWCGT